MNANAVLMPASMSMRSSSPCLADDFLLLRAFFFSTSRGRFFDSDMTLTREPRASPLRGECRDLKSCSLFNPRLRCERCQVRPSSVVSSAEMSAEREIVFCCTPRLYGCQHPNQLFSMLEFLGSARPCAPFRLRTVFSRIFLALVAPSNVPQELRIQCDLLLTTAACKSTLSFNSALCTFEF